jgi:hypothetical protein
MADFAGSSKYIKQQILEFAIKQFKNLTERQSGYSFKNVDERLKWLEDQLSYLKQLQDEN